MPIYGQKVIVHHLYITDILRYMWLAENMVPSFAKHCIITVSLDLCKISLIDNLLNNKTIILLNLTEYHLIFTNSTYSVIG